MGEQRFDEKYALYYDLFNLGKDYSQESDFLQKTFTKYSQNQIKKILDLGCGTGAHTAHLAQRGFQMTGLDLSPHMIKRAQGKNIPHTEFHEGNMTSFTLNQQFDAIICMFASLGYVTTNKELESTFRTIKKHLTPGGLLIFDVWNGLGVLKEPPSSRTKTGYSEGYVITRTSHPTLDAAHHICTVNFDVNVTKDEHPEDTFTETHKVRFFFPQELKKYLEDAGFEVLEMCEPFTLGTSITEHTWNIAIIARALTN